MWKFKEKTVRCSERMEVIMHRESALHGRPEIPVAAILDKQCNKRTKTTKNESISEKRVCTGEAEQVAAVKRPYSAVCSMCD